LNAKFTLCRSAFGVDVESKSQFFAASVAPTKAFPHNPVSCFGPTHRSSEQHANSDGFFLAGWRGPYLSAVRQTPGRDRK